MRIIIGRVRQGAPARQAAAPPVSGAGAHRPHDTGESATLFTPRTLAADAARPRGRTKHPAGRRRASPAASGKSAPGGAVFALLGIAFAATAAAGLHLGAGEAQQAALKAAALSAQLSYPQGGQTVAARELQKLRAWFAALGGGAASQAASAASAASGTASAGAAGSTASKAASSAARAASSAAQ